MFKLTTPGSRTSRIQYAGMLLFACCVLLGLAPPTRAYQPQQAPSAGATSVGDGSAEEQVILIAEHRTATAATKRDELNSLVKEALNTVFTQGGGFKAITFSPYMPALSRAVLAHTLEVTDLEEPLTPEALHKIAQTLGARNILTFHATHEKLAIKTEIKYEQIAAQNAWRTTLTNQFHTDPVLGKRKLKLEEMVDVNVDAIAKSLGVKSTLLQDLHLEIALPPVPAANTRITKPDKSTLQKSDSTDQSAIAVPATGTTQGQTTGTDTGGALSSTTAQDTVPTPSTKAAGNSGRNRKQAPPDPYYISKDLKPGSGDGAQPVPTVATHPGVEENISNEARARRYRQSGDLSSTILYLRRAVDDKPDDVAVRRQLIQAYQDDNEPDLAVAEIGRSLRLDSKNAMLFRLYGDAMASKGSVSEALRAYKQAAELDPKDVLTRIALGDTLLHDGQYDAGIQAYHDAAAGAPTSPLPHRKLARAACQRAASDPEQYAQAIAEIKKARSLTPPTDTQNYQEDYSSIMKIMESRLVDILDQLDNTYSAYVRAQSTKVETNRVIKDMSERANAASDFIDALPAAAGQEGTQAIYQEGTASVISAIVYLKSFVSQGDTQFEDKLKTERVTARHDLTAAGKKLKASRPPAPVN